MLFISKDSEQAKLVSKLAKNSSELLETTISSDSISFRFEGNGAYDKTHNFKIVVINLQQKLDIKTVYKIKNASLLLALASILEDADIEFTTSSSKLCFNDFSFKYEETSGSYNTDISELITFNKEQFNSFEEDFFITAGNYWIKPELSNVSALFIKEGELKRVAPGASAYKITDVKGVIDETTINQRFGHDTFGITISKELYDLVAPVNFEKISFDILGSNVYRVKIDNIAFIEVNPYKIGANIFKRNVGKINSLSFKTLEIPEELKKCLSSFSKNTSEFIEDKRACITSSSDTVNLAVTEDDNVIFSCKGNLPAMKANFNALSFVLNKNDVEISSFALESCDMYVFKSGDNYYFVNEDSN